MELKKLQTLAEGIDLSKFEALKKASKDVGFKPIKAAGMTPEQISKAMDIGLASFKKHGDNFWVDTTGMRKAINTMDYLASIIDEFGGDGSKIKAAKEEAAKIEPIASLASTISTDLTLFAQGRKNSSWKPEKQEIAKEICKLLGIK